VQESFADARMTCLLAWQPEFCVQHRVHDRNAELMNSGSFQDQEMQSRSHRILIEWTRSIRPVSGSGALQDL